MAIYRNGVRVKRPTTSSNSSSDEESAEKNGGRLAAMPHAHPAQEKGVKQPADPASRPLDVRHSKDPSQRKRKCQSTNMVFGVLNGGPTEKKRRTLECNLSSRDMDTDLHDGDLRDGVTQAYQVGDSICHLPSDLTELEDLRPILSLESWNFLLTEEERESLSVYLPDVDESTFKDTLTELFAGSNFNFSSPMTDLLQQLKGGLCNPEIAKYREALRLLEKKQHYHNVRNYHNGFVNTCLEMRSLWLSHGDAGLDERLKQWYSHKLRLDDSKAHYGQSQSDIPLEQVNEEKRRVPRVREPKVINKARDEAKVPCKQLLTVESKQCLSPSLGREVDPGVSVKSKSKQRKVLSLEQAEHKLDFAPAMAETEDALIRNVRVKKVDVLSGSKQKRWKDEISLSQSRLQAKVKPSAEVNSRCQERSLQEGSWKESAGSEGDAERLASHLHNSFSGFQQSQLLKLEDHANGANRSSSTEIRELRNGTLLQMCEKGIAGEDETPSCSRKEAFLDEKLQRTDLPAATLGFPFSVLHFISAVRMALLIPFETGDNDPKEVSSETDSGREEGDFEMPYLKSAVPAVSFQELVRRVRACPGDNRALERQEPLEGLVRGVLRVLSCKTKPEFDWKAFVAYNKKDRVWKWIGVVPLSINVERPQISAEVWGIPESVLYKIQEAFASWLTSAQAMLQQLGQLARLPLPLLPAPMDERDRFRESRQQKGLVTINPTSDEMRAFFQKEEAVRYSFPDTAFFYTNAAGKKSAVAPLKRVGGKPNSKARDHPILKLDRPSHVTILCLVRDAAARLPDNTGTRADVCTLIHDSQYIVDDVCDAQLSQVVSGALDRLHYERDPCVRYDGDKKLWVYLHADRDEDDFEDNGTASTKRSRRSKKEGIEQVDYTVRDNQDGCDSEHDNNSPQYASAMRDSPYEIYPTAGTPELLYNHHSASLTSTPLIVRGQFQEDCALPFIDLPPSVQPACANMQSSGGLGSIVNGSHNGYITLGVHL